jgi:hypothetical protein
MRFKKLGFRLGSDLALLRGFSPLLPNIFVYNRGPSGFPSVCLVKGGLIAAVNTYDPRKDRRGLRPVELDTID